MPKEINKEIESQILDYLNEHEKLSTTYAVELFQLSESTIRRMFTRLENQKKVVRVYGGIILAEQDTHYRYEFVRQKNKEQKRAIGRYATKLIDGNDFIFMDCGTTTAYMANAISTAIREHRLSNSLHVVTNSLINLEILNSCCNVTLVGGKLFEERKSTADVLAINFLSQFHFSKAFLGADGMSFEHGFSTDNIYTCQLSRTAMLLSQKSYVLLDSSKIDQPSYVNYGGLDEVTGIITDDKITLEQQKLIFSYPLELHIAH